MTINPETYQRFRETIELFRTSPEKPLPIQTTPETSKLEIR